MNLDVNLYFNNGCGRCPLGGTPECKVHDWQHELRELRRIVQASDLTEECKWGVPCYAFNGKNVATVSALKTACVLSFFKGALIDDAHGLLEKLGENTQAARVVRFTDVEGVVSAETAIKNYITQAIEIEKSGKKVEFKTELTYPEELVRKFAEDPTLADAFEALTPGRRKGYALHFSGAKQAKTRVARIEKCIPKIMAGKGFHDR